MVVKMMKWRPWPTLSTKKFETRIYIHCLKGVQVKGLENSAKLLVEIKWKGSKGKTFSSLRKRLRRNCTKEEALREDGIVEWNEEFRTVCCFSGYKDGVFSPWEVEFSVFNAMNQGNKNKVPIALAALLNLAKFASQTVGKEMEVSIPLMMKTGNLEGNPSLCLSLSLLELRAVPEPPEVVQRTILFPRSPCYGEVLTTDRDEDEVSAVQAGLKKGKIFKASSTGGTNKAGSEEEGSDGRSSARSEDVEYNSPLDTDSLYDTDEEESEEGKEDFSIRKSFTYGTLAYVNHAGRSYYSNASGSEDEDWIYYSNSKSDTRELYVKDSPSSVLDISSRQSSKRRILLWRRRNLGFRSPKAKGEPLLNKNYGEDGGDDIDFDRRQLSSSDESSIRRRKMDEGSAVNGLSASEFGDDSFTVGSWEAKEVISRDGLMKLQTQVFFASIDQRSERAAGESACTALVAVIADWFQLNCEEMPIKCQLDSLIREGSWEWRNLCENDAYRERFPDKHFDLDTVLQAKLRPLSVIPEKSFIGFFHPEELEETGFDFLYGAMSFDSIWDEITRVRSNGLSNDDPLIYIVSWNDHFFILKVEQDAYYIIDTLGERLYEGCNQAYILKFDRDTTIQRLTVERNSSDEKLTSDIKSSDEKSASDKSEPIHANEASTEETRTDKNNKPGNSAEEELLVCKGKESCKEYIKSFLAAIPIRELQADLKRGLMASTPVHHRLQIEFHYTQCFPPVAEDSSVESIANIPAALELAVA